jgi:tRNA(Ile)-lysidine synthase
VAGAGWDTTLVDQRPSRMTSSPPAETGQGGRKTWPPLVGGLLSRSCFPPAGEAVICAVSGGPDSVAMLALAVAAGCQAHALHVDHGLRPESGREAALVMAAADALGATCELVRVHVEPGGDLEARARRARYQVLPDGVLVGHTADDQAETLLLNLLRGAGLDGLAGMRAKDGGHRRVRRPILGLRRQETAALVRALDLEVVDDPSNHWPQFRRNRARHEVMPLLADVAGRDPVPLLARTASLLAEDAELLASLAEGLDPTDARALRAAPAPLARRALRRWLRDGPELHPPSASELERVWQVVVGRVVACEIAGGRRVSRSGGRLRLDAAGTTDGVGGPVMRPASLR